MVGVVVSFGRIIKPSEYNHEITLEDNIRWADSLELHEDDLGVFTSSEEREQSMKDVMKT